MKNVTTVLRTNNSLFQLVMLCNKIGCCIKNNRINHTHSLNFLKCFSSLHFWIFSSFLMVFCVFSLDILFSCFIKVFPSLQMLLFLFLFILDTLFSSSRFFFLLWCCFASSSWILFLVVSTSFFFFFAGVALYSQPWYCFLLFHQGFSFFPGVALWSLCWILFLVVSSKFSFFVGIALYFQPWYSF